MGSSISNLPNGVGSFGAPVFPDIGPGGYAMVKFVGSAQAGYQTAAAGDSYQNPAPTLLSMLRDGVVDSGDRGTLIVVRKGHAETISVADYFTLLGARKRIRIIGEGEGPERPTFTWSTATSSWLLDTDSVFLENLILKLEPTTGTVTVAAPITISAAGVGIRKCRINFGTDANNKVTIGITTTAAANDLQFKQNVARGAAAATCTTFLRLVGGDSAQVWDNDIVGGTTAAAVGVVQALTTPPTNVDFQRNYFENNIAAGTAAVTFMAAATGKCTLDRYKYNGTGLAAVTTTGLVGFWDCKVVNAVVDGTPEAGTLFGTPSA